MVEDPGDIASLAMAIEPFLNPKIYAPASIAARQTAESLPFNRNVERTLEVFDKLKL